MAIALYAGSAAWFLLGDFGDRCGQGWRLGGAGAAQPIVVD